MPIKKINEFQNQMTGPNILLSAGLDGSDLMPEMSVHFITLKLGEAVSPHVHDRVEVYVFLSGTAKVMTGDEIKEVSTGDVAIAPIGTPHAIQVLGDEPLLFYALNSPPSSTCPMEAASDDVIKRFENA
ncbi:cupin domain-containing protein [Candidatus Latescibacterota bacterium]